MKKYLIVLLTLFIYTCSDDPAAPKEGCTSMTACNYDATAAVDDGSCLEPGAAECCTDDNQVSTHDCADTCGGTAVEDCAGTCNGPGIPDGNSDCCASGSVDCAGTCDGTAVEDCAGACGGSAVVGGCDNVCGSTAVDDACGVCGGDGSSCAGGDLSCTDLTTVCSGSDCNTLALDPTSGIVYYNFTDPIAGVQFNITGGTAASASGGAAGSVGWILNAAGATVLGFSFSNTEIPAGSGELFTITGDLSNATGLDTIVATTASSADVTTVTSTDACTAD